MCTDHMNCELHAPTTQGNAYFRASWGRVVKALCASTSGTWEVTTDCPVSFASKSPFCAQNAIYNQVFTKSAF